MVKQDVLEGLEVLRLEQVCYGASGQFGECLVGRSEDGEGSCTFEGIDQTGSLHCSHQGGEATIRHCGINDVHGSGDSSSRNDCCRRGGGGGCGTSDQNERSEQQYEQ